jgi:hypothetical protein
MFFNEARKADDLKMTNTKPSGIFKLDESKQAEKCEC